MTTSRTLTDVEVIFRNRTERAVCVRVTEDGPDVWLPVFSGVEIEPIASTELRRGSVATLTAPEWVLIEKGLI